jgi:hypothetical protein
MRDLGQFHAYTENIWHEGLTRTKKFADHSLSGLCRVHDLCRVSSWPFTVSFSLSCVCLALLLCLYVCRFFISAVCRFGLRSTWLGTRQRRSFPCSKPRRHTTELLSTVAVVFPLVHVLPPSQFMIYIRFSQSQTFCV